MARKKKTPTRKKRTFKKGRLGTGMAESAAEKIRKRRKRLQNI